MNELCFCSAAYGGWGIVRVGTLVPESHMLFACAYSCGRHNAIGAAQHGYREQISYMYIDEADLSLGILDEDLNQAVEEILEMNEKAPKVILLFVSCVLYMAGFDWESAIAQLSERFPQIRFQACMMNPVASDRQVAPALAMQNSLCELWDTTGTQRNTLNLIGSYVSLDPQSEIFPVLRACGIEDVLHWSEMKTYDEYKQMGASRYNLVLRPEGNYAAQRLKERMDYRFVPVSYGVDQVDAQYEQIFDMLGKRVDLEPYREKARAAIARAREVVGGRRIAVGASATCRPYSMALALLESGFEVSDIFTGGCSAYEKEARDTLRAQYPQVVMHDIFSPENVKQVGAMGSADIAVGYSAGYHTGAPIVVNMMTDEGMFGYRAIELLMEKLIDSVQHPCALEAMIESYGLIV